MVKFMDYSQTNVHSDGYTVLDPSVAKSCSSIIVVDSSGQLMKLAVGPKGKEVDLCAFQGNGDNVRVRTFLNKGDRLCVRSLVVPVTSGQIAVTYL